MKHETDCEHGNSIFSCKKCAKEVFDSFLEMKLEAIEKMESYFSEEELDINSVEFLRQA
jgi:hypothetical protein